VNFHAFREDCDKQWPGFGGPAGAQAEHPRDRRLAMLLRKVEGLASENKLMLLNLAAHHLAPGEIYVEVGSWRGLSLAGAAAGNAAEIYACDDFSSLRRDRRALQRTLERYTAPGQVRFYDSDFREFLTLVPWLPKKVGVYFYDAGHSFAEQFQALELILPSLSDDALVVVDDTNDAPVRAANRLFLRHTPGLELVADIRTAADRSPTWWNGLQVLRFRRGFGSAFRQPPRASYLAHRVLFTGLLTGAQRLAKIASWGPRLYRDYLAFGNGARLGRPSERP
jgi:predicted O-methyltransferase YrrM